MRRDISTHTPTQDEKRHRVFEEVIDLCDSEEELEQPRDIIARQDKEYEEALLADLARITNTRQSQPQPRISSSKSPCHPTASSPVPSRVLPTDRRARAALFAKAFEKGIDVSIPSRLW